MTTGADSAIVVTILRSRTGVGTTIALMIEVTANDMIVTMIGITKIGTTMITITIGITMIATVLGDVALQGAATAQTDSAGAVTNGDRGPSGRRCHSLGRLSGFGWRGYLLLSPRRT